LRVKLRLQRRCTMSKGIRGGISRWSNWRRGVVMCFNHLGVGDVLYTCYLIQFMVDADCIFINKCIYGFNLLSPILLLRIIHNSNITQSSFSRPSHTSSPLLPRISCNNVSYPCKTPSTDMRFHYRQRERVARTTPRQLLPSRCSIW
jgi:hypothetical protein